MLNHHGFVRVAAAVPKLRVADCDYNADRILGLLSQAQQENVDVVVFPELALTGYTCGDLFQQVTLQRAADAGLKKIIDANCGGFTGLAVIGLPLAVEDQLFNCAAVLQRGFLFGVVPKTFLPNYKEFYERRWFSPAANANRREAVVAGNVETCFGTNMLFTATDVPGLCVGVEICEDLWMPIPPSAQLTLHGATLLVNLSASNEIIGKAAYRRQLVLGQSARCVAGYVYASCGVGESTTDLVFGGHCLIAENGSLLAESKRFQREETLLVADVDVERLVSERQRTSSFGDAHLPLVREKEYQRFAFSLDPPALPRPLRRQVDAHPFVPRGQDQLAERCQEIFQTQVAALAKRLEHIGTPPVSIGISGGLDSTLALLVVRKTYDLLGAARANIQALTLPGFGTTLRTKNNARALMRELQVSAQEIDIRALCLEEMKALGHKPFGIALEGLGVAELTAKLQQLTAEQRADLVFENIQARMRTSLLMNRGFVIGTGDLSELALGWCTYNADHMSMYNPNVSIPKTLVKFLVEWAARNEFSGEAQRILLDIVATVISPELLPTGAAGEALQSTEEVVGPYELHDFFLYHFLRFGSPPEKILYLAGHAEFHRTYTNAELRKWLKEFIRRFFASQYKRSCLPDGPKVGSVSLSPRGDWRMPSDAQAAAWLTWVDEPVA